MFRLRNTVTPVKRQFERAVAQLPVAHQSAVTVATTHLHETAVEAALQAGRDPAALTVAGHPSAPFVGIEQIPEGHQLANQEYGTPKASPSPVLRTAVRNETPTAKKIYDAHLRQGLGL